MKNKEWKWRECEEDAADDDTNDDNGIEEK